MGRAVVDVVVELVEVVVVVGRVVDVVVELVDVVVDVGRVVDVVVELVDVVVVVGRVVDVVVELVDVVVDVGRVVDVVVELVDVSAEASASMPAEAARVVEPGCPDVDGAPCEGRLHLRGRQRRVLVEEQRGDTRRVRRGRRRAEEGAEGRAGREAAGVRDRDAVERDEIGLGADLEPSGNRCARVRAS